MLKAYGCPFVRLSAVCVCTLPAAAPGSGHEPEAPPPWYSIRVSGSPCVGGTVKVISACRSRPTLEWLSVAVGAAAAPGTVCAAIGAEDGLDADVVPPAFVAVTE